MTSGNFFLFLKRPGLSYVVKIGGLELESSDPFGSASQIAECTGAHHPTAAVE
jgi:hypothetical protein